MIENCKNEDDWKAQGRNTATKGCFTADVAATTKERPSAFTPKSKGFLGRKSSNQTKNEPRA